MKNTEVKSATRKYWNRSADRYDKARRLEWDAWKDLLGAMLGYSKGLAVLDVGTGPGTIAIPLAAMGHDVTGVDLSENMIEKAKRNAEKNGLLIHFETDDAENLSFKDNLFDVVINKWLLWALPDPETAISEWKRVLKPGGSLIIIDGNWWDFRKSLIKCIWYHFLAMPLVSITERRNAWNSYSHIEKHLPMTSKERPEADIGLLNDFGFVSIEARKVNIPTTQTLIGYLKYGYQEGQFLARGVKT